MALIPESGVAVWQTKIEKKYFYRNQGVVRHKTFAANMDQKHICVNEIQRTLKYMLF